MSRTTERVPFRLIDMPCCHFQFCNVNSRFPSFCPNCGKHVYPAVKGCVIILDEKAILKYETSALDRAKALGAKIADAQTHLSTIGEQLTAIETRVFGK